MKMKQMNEDKKKTDSIEKRKGESEKRQINEDKARTKRIEDAKRKTSSQ
jgi:hypothetical protein